LPTLMLLNLNLSTASHPKKKYDIQRRSSKIIKDIPGFTNAQAR